MHRNLRILVLLLILLLLASMTFFERMWVRSWSRPLQIAIYPIALDASSAAYVARLRAEDFRDITAFLESEVAHARRKSIARPHLVLKPALSDLPPIAHARNRFETLQLSLHLRWYAFRHTPFLESLGTVRLFVLYHPLHYDQSLPHSLGLQKGLFGFAHVFADDAQRAQNNMVITHELLHTLGARDKYDTDGQPVYPVGFADPYADPRYPQHKAEIMAGRIPVTEQRAEIPQGLSESVVGYATAAEIGW
jgi:hypothetical protein